MESVRSSSIDLNLLSAFVAVAQAGGFTAAAQRLDVAKTRLSIDVRRLEQLLGVALFTRTTRRVTLTDAGRTLLARSAPLLGGLDEALAGASGSTAVIAGSLKVAASVDHAVQSLAPAVAAFSALHPALRIQLLASDRVSDMVAEGIDVSFRVGWLRDSSLRAAKIGSFEQYVLAAPAYVRRHGAPARPADLAGHRWIALTLLPTPLTWKFTSRSGRVSTVRVSAALQTDSSAALRAMLVSGAGISVLNHLNVQEDLRTGRLVRVLDRWSIPGGGIHAVYPPGHHMPASVRAFVDFYRVRLDAGARASEQAA